MSDSLSPPPPSAPANGPEAPPPPPAPPRPREPGLLARMRANWQEIWAEHKVMLACLAFVLLFLLAFFWNQIFVLIRSGQAGVIYRPFSGGTDVTRTYDEGFHIVAPWNRMVVYEARVQQVADEFRVLSSDGLEIAIEISIRYRPLRKDLGLLHKHIGPDYVDKIVKPEMQSKFRFVLGQYRPEEIYASQGFIVQTVKQGGLAELAERYILLDDLLLKAVRLPLPVAQSIESKLRAQQLALEFDYRLETEVKEAQRKRIEADGIRAFQEIITSGGMTESYLRFRGIQATLELAKSPNSKVIVIGGGKDGLPLILDGRTDIPLSSGVLPNHSSGGGRSADPQAGGTAP